MRYMRGLLLVLMLGALAACQPANKNSPFPHISLNNFGPTTVKAGNVSDTVFLAFDFTDGDGDLNSSTFVKLIDSRDSSVRNYPFATIDPSLIDPDRGLEGICYVKIQAAGLVIRTDSVHFEKGDTLSYTTYITDAAGNESNRLNTPQLIIRP